MTTPAPVAFQWRGLQPQPDGLGESPFWHPQERRLYWVDIPGRMLRRSDGQGGELESWPMPSEPGCIAPARSGGLVIALRDGIYRAKTWGGPLALLARAVHDPATTRFNDGKADPLGRFWAGTLYEPKGDRLAALYCLDGRPGRGAPSVLTLEQKAGDNVTANGLAWSPDQRTLYWAATGDHEVRAWDWDGEGNLLSNPRLFHRFDAKPPGWQPGQPGYGGRPDGAAVDSAGDYWCALYEGARLVRLSPEGVVRESIPVPVLCPTMPCFGGDDLKTLYVTTASEGDAAARIGHPLAGQVLWTRVATPGLPVNFFSD